jgi:hypothetical protein
MTAHRLQCFDPKHGVILEQVQVLNLDDCWQEKRDETGHIVPNSQKFPSGIKVRVSVSCLLSKLDNLQLSSSLYFRCLSCVDSY